MATVLAIAVACLMPLAAIFLAQDRLLYFPERTSVERIAGDRLRAWPSGTRGQWRVPCPRALRQGHESPASNGGPLLMIGESLGAAVAAAAAAEPLKR